MHRLTCKASRAAQIIPLVLVAGAMALSIQAFRSGSTDNSGVTPALVTPNYEVSTCNLRHPIEARLVPQGAMTRGGTVRVALEVEATVSLSAAEARILSSGGATILGRQRAELGTLDAGDVRRIEFTLRLPENGRRFVLQVLTTGESTTGPMNRLAMLNILPDGPADPGQVVTTPTGESIRQYASSGRRIN
ncbi:MAG: hypothetical protein SGI90_07585 [Candidatus Eisenbacteria bacterium]|nr:hypothetical protein [Candidatus Eisenbacteria bacterium]